MFSKSVSQGRFESKTPVGSANRRADTITSSNKKTSSEAVTTHQTINVEELARNHDSELDENKIGVDFVIMKEKREGSGSYGSVYKCRDEYGNIMAIKCMDMDQEVGIPNVLEASIMTTMDHPNISKALKIYADDKKFHILQELAICDLSKKTRKDKGGSIPSIDDLRTWCFGIIQALLFLHNHNIIHADIKSSNLLLFSNNLVKLTDFTLSVKKWFPDVKFTHQACTPTHQPLESIMNDEWDFPLDIWSLGCTFYEIAFGCLLFKNQKIEMPASGPKSRFQQRSSTDTIKQLMNNKLIHAIYDWADRNPIPETYSAVKPSDGLDYEKFELSSLFDKEEYKDFTDLVLAMLRINPKERLSIIQVSEHKFFAGLVAVPGRIRETPCRTITSYETRCIEKSIDVFKSQYKFDRFVLDWTIKLCANSCVSMSENTKISFEYRIVACYWIAHKIINGTTPVLVHKLSDVKQAERMICRDIRYRLHEYPSLEKSNDGYKKIEKEEVKEIDVAEK